MTTTARPLTRAEQFRQWNARVSARLAPAKAERKAS